MDTTEEIGLNPADFSARVVAFSVDLGLAAAGYFVSLKLCFPAYSPFLNPHARLWIALWTAAFILYQAYASCEGRRSAGKALVGLRVVDARGEPLSMGAAAVRSALYLASSIFNLGFLWSLWNPARQCWHDMAVGSRVISDHPRTPARTAAMRALACLCAAILGGGWYWNNILGVRYRRVTDLAYANVELKELKGLQRLHYRRRGRYATSLAELAAFSSSPQDFLHDTPLLLTDIRITTTPTGYKILANAADDGKTPIVFTGP